MFNPAERRDSHGRWTKGGVGPLLGDVLKGHNVRGLGTNSGTATEPINVGGNVMLGARLIAQGKHVRLNRVDQIGTLLTDLLKMSKEAKKKHEVLDLCRVSVPKTNLFCAQNKGIDRIDMPQLAGVPKPGSKGAELQSAPGEEVDLTQQFEAALRSHGVKVTDTTLPAASFKASQDQLVGDKVAGIEKFMETAPKDSRVFEPIFVTRDHYIIDGHHRWAAMVGLDAKDGVLGNFPMKVRMVDMDIGEALAAANAFAEDWGIGHEGVTKTGPTISKFKPKADLSLAFNADQPRDSHGRWVGHKPRGVGAMLDAMGKAEGSKPTKRSFGDFRVSQLEAQAHAERVFKDAPGVYTGLFNDPDQTMDMPPCPERSWAAYQMEGGYQTINGYLRNGEHIPWNNITDESPEQLANDMLKAFDKMGYDTQKPGTLYRVNVGGHAVPYESLKPGAVFTDKGVISTTAQTSDAAGFYEQEELAGHVEQPYLEEIHVPAGTRVLGGARGSIETMLRPGTRFKVIGTQTKEIQAHWMGMENRVRLPTVILEVQP